MSRPEQEPVAIPSPPADMPISAEPHLQLVEPIPDHTRSANVLRAGANIVSISRGIGGIALGYKVATNDYPANRWNMALGTALFAVSDRVDGEMARAANRLDGQQGTIGPWADQMSDKLFTTGLTIGLARACFTNHRRVTGTIMTAVAAVSTARDVMVTRKRIQAEQSDLQIDTGAKMFGKIKTAVQLAGLTAAVSPLVKNKHASRLITGVLSVSAGLAVTSGFAYRRQFNKALKGAQATSPTTAD